MSSPVARLAVGLAVIVVALVVARVVQSRRQSDVPTGRRAILPDQIDRDDFDHRDAPWLVAVFTSDTCATCADVADKAKVLGCDDVGVQIVSYQHHKELQRRYGIDSVPSLVVADVEGVVQASAVGPITATDLWAMVADVRFPGSIERGGCDSHEHDT